MKAHTSWQKYQENLNLYFKQISQPKSRLGFHVIANGNLHGLD